METLRVSLHVLAATIWVGGQLVLAGLVPALREIGGDAPKVVAQRFNQIAWPAFGVLLLTGIWNLLAAGEIPTSWHPAIDIKFMAVIFSGVGAFVHQRANGNKAMLAAGGAASSIFAVVALVLGVALK